MSGSLTALAFTFEVASIDLESVRELPVVGEWCSEPDLEEIPIAGDVRANDTGRFRLRGFHVRKANLASDGLYAGDYLLVQPRERVRSNELVVTECMGTFSVRRVSGPGGIINALVPPVCVHLRSHTTIVGAFAGIVRIRSTRARERFPTGPNRLPMPRAMSSLERLAGQLAMLEATCSRTDNPRLRRALRAEAEQIRNQLRSGAAID